MSDENLRAYMKRVGDELREGRIPENYMDVSSLYQLALGNPAVKAAMHTLLDAADPADPVHQPDEGTYAPPMRAFAWLLRWHGPVEISRGALLAMPRGVRIVVEETPDSIRLRATPPHPRRGG